MAREMKNSGVDIVGQIPAEWNSIRLRYLCNITTGDSDTQDADPDGVYPFYVRSPKVERSLKFTFDGEGILMAGDGAGAGRIFHIVSGKYAVHQRVYRLYNFRINSNYLFYYISNLFPSIMDQGSAQSTVPSVRLPMLLNFEVCLPPHHEQQAIADFLDTKCAEIDGLLADLDAEIKTLTEYKKSIIAETVTRGLNPNVPMKQSGIPWVGEMPSHWKVIANKYIMHKKKNVVPIYEGQDIISLSMNGVIVRDLDAGGKMPTSFNGYQHIYPGNLLMCLFDIDVTPRCIGLIKNDGLTSPAYSQFVMDKDAYAPYYYYFYLKMDNNKELVHLSKNMRHSLNEEQFGMIKTILPPREEQEAIATYLDEKCASIDQSIVDKQTQIETLKSYKASLIYEYVTGKKQVI